MADRTDDSNQDEQLARTRESQRPDRKADRAQPDTSENADSEQPVESRPRGKTEDPDRTL